MATTDPITDEYIDSIIKANQPGTPDPDKTSGQGLRELIKRLRDQVGPTSTDDIAEGLTNLFYTNDRVQAYLDSTYTPYVEQNFLPYSGATATLDLNQQSLETHGAVNIRSGGAFSLTGNADISGHLSVNDLLAGALKVGFTTSGAVGIGFQDRNDGVTATYQWENKVITAGNPGGLTLFQLNYGGTVIFQGREDGVLQDANGHRFLTIQDFTGGLYANLSGGNSFNGTQIINGQLVTDINIGIQDLAVTSGSNDFGKLIIGQNRSDSRGETDFISFQGTAPEAKGGFSFRVMELNHTIERELFKMDGEAGGIAEFFTAIKTPNPAGSAAQPFKLGQPENVSGKSLNSGHAITIEIGGTTYYLALLD